MVYIPFRTIRAKLDPTATFDENKRHWKLALFDSNGDPVDFSGGGSPATPSAREAVTHTTASLAQNAAEDFTIATAGKRATVLRGVSDRPCRLRVYPTAALRAADAARPVATDPVDGTGCLMELVFTAGLLDIPLAPTVDLFNLDDPVAAVYYCRLEANHATPGTYTVTLTVQEEE